MSEQTAEVNKYPNLTKNFLKGSLKGQINSVHGSRETNPGKVADFKKALADGEIVISSVLTKGQCDKLTEMGIAIPDEFKYVPKEPAKKETPAA